MSVASLGCNRDGGTGDWRRLAGRDDGACVRRAGGDAGDGARPDALATRTAPPVLSPAQPAGWKCRPQPQQGRCMSPLDAALCARLAYEAAGASLAARFGYSYSAVAR